jgi:hypothetical protein
MIDIKNYYEVEGCSIVGNAFVYDMLSSSNASGYAMQTKIEKQPIEQVMKRAKKLGKAKQGSGHDSFLKGIIVNFDISMNHLMMPQFMRYHFQDTVTSQSKMHRLLTMDLYKQCDEYVDHKILQRLEMYRVLYNQSTKKEDKDYYWRILVSSSPLGLKLTSRVTTNYLQLKSMYMQRKNHKLKEWREFCEWILTLPHFSEFTGLK